MSEAPEDHHALFGGRQRIDDSHRRCEALTLVEAVDDRVRVHLLVATDAHEPWIVTSWDLALFDAAEVNVTGDREMRPVLKPDGFTLEPVQWRVDRSALEVVRRVDAARCSVREDQLDLRLPFVDRDLDAIGAHAPDDLATLVPLVVVPENDGEPLHATFEQEPLGQPPGRRLRHLLIAEQTGKTADPIVRVVSNVDRVDAGCFGDDLHVTAKKGDVAAWIVDVDVTHERNADRHVVSDCDLLPRRGVAIRAFAPVVCLSPVKQLFGALVPVR